MNYPETSQEIFDAVWRHFVVENRPRSYSDRRYAPCAYRGRDGARCAVGIFIPDESYRPTMDSEHQDTGVRVLLEKGEFHHDSALEEFIANHVGFLVKLQKAHDRPNMPIAVSLRDVAREERLEVPDADR